MHSLNLNLDHSFLNDNFDIEKDKKEFRTILIILNRPIDSPELFEKLLAVHDTIICSDGGANRLLKYSGERSDGGSNGNDRNDNSVNPNYIIGDLDSISKQTQQFYEKQKGVQIIKIED